MPFEAFVAFRYLWGKRRSLLVMLITLLSIFGVAAGVTILNWTLSVMTGFEEDLKAKILGMNSDAVVLKYGGEIDDWEPVLEDVRNHERVAGATPFTYNEVMLQSDSSVTGTILKGADPASLPKVTDLLENICLDVTATNKCGKDVVGPGAEDTRQEILNKIGELHEVEGRNKPVPGILLGRELADSLLVLEGELVRVVAPSGAIGPGGAYPKMKTFMVVGTFKTGMWEYDTKFAFTSIEAAQQVAGTGGGITGIELKTDDVYKAPKVADQIEADLGYPYTVKDWIELNGALFGALKMEKIVMGLLQSWVIFLGGVCIVCILTIIVLEKRGEIAVLKTLGASNGMIVGIFTLQGSAIGLIGTLLGTLAGLGGAKILQAIKFPLDTRVYYLDSVPVVLEPTNFLVVAVIAVITSVIAAMLPSFVGAAQRPVEGLQHE